MNNFIKKLREKGLKKKINQFIDTFEDKLDTNVDLVNQKTKENVLNDRKIYNYLVELAGLKQEKYILPNDFNKIQSIFINLREDKVEQAKSKMFCINIHSMFCSINFDTFYEGLTFKYKNKLIEHYKNIKNELFGEDFVNPYFVNTGLNINNDITNINSTTSISLIPSGKNKDGYLTYSYKDPRTGVLTTVTIDSNGHVLDRQVYTPSLFSNIKKFE